VVGRGRITARKSDQVSERQAFLGSPMSDRLIAKAPTAVCTAIF
jgi:hypothetical protein